MAHEIAPEDGLPTVVCSSCRDQLESCHRFRRVAHRTQKSLQSYLAYAAALAGSEEGPLPARNDVVFPYNTVITVAIIICPEHDQV
uniref:ZAD domain-containing protein n=1 Tax=Anopheles epiroticus TaxID=199890 RepID=A0A182PMG6_9DIPT